MKQYIIDELRPEDYTKIKNYFDDNLIKSKIDGIYWVELEYDMLSEIQKQHYDKCAPFYFAFDLENDKLCCELLVRSKNTIRCQCISDAEAKQINWIIGLVDTMNDRLGIIT